MAGITGVIHHPIVHSVLSGNTFSSTMRPLSIEKSKEAALPKQGDAGIPQERPATIKRKYERTCTEDEDEFENKKPRLVFHRKKECFHLSYSEKFHSSVVENILSDESCDNDQPSVSGHPPDAKWRKGCEWNFRIFCFKEETTDATKIPKDSCIHFEKSYDDMEVQESSPMDSETLQIISRADMASVKDDAEIRSKPDVMAQSIASTKKVAEILKLTTRKRPPMGDLFDSPYYCRAKIEVEVMNRIAQLQAAGLWPDKKMPKCSEPARRKCQWDFLLEESLWLSEDFRLERKWKQIAAKKQGKMVEKHFQSKMARQQKSAREREQNLKRVASFLSKSVKQFWQDVGKLVEYKHKTILDVRRKQVMNQHLSYIVKESEKISDMVAQSMNKPSAVNSASSSVVPSEAGSDTEFEPNQSSSDDEETIEAEEATKIKRRALTTEEEEDECSEIDTLTKDSMLPLEDLLNQLPEEYIKNSNLFVKECSGPVQKEGCRQSRRTSTKVENVWEKCDRTRRSSNYDSSDKSDSEPESSLTRSLIQDTNNADTKEDDINTAAELAQSLQPKGNTLSSTSVVTPVPKLLRHELREYQHIGLDWLVTMYERHLNGILADEMGLGKTIQTIALLAHLAYQKQNWGPHLIIVPTSVMLNWEMEFKKWCPAFKVVTYYGSPKERKLKRTGWTKYNAFHVCITSYKLVVQDHGSFRRRKWQYLILDEAHNIKNFKSQRWQLLLNFQTERRLLLTGTPLQNNLMELWSLMHFLMPDLFASQAEFKEWFSNPLTGMIEGNSEYDEKIVKRLHKVLRPFLLRRLKCEVEKQLPKKHEHIVWCRLSKRQRFLYEDYMSRSKTKETLKKGNFLHVIDVLMQLRKVCNHPNLFEPRPIVSPFCMQRLEFQAPVLSMTPLEYHPLEKVNLKSLHLCLADAECEESQYVAFALSQYELPRKEIECMDEGNLKQLLANDIPATDRFPYAAINMVYPNTMRALPFDSNVLKNYPILSKYFINGSAKISNKGLKTALEWMMRILIRNDEVQSINSVGNEVVINGGDSTYSDDLKKVEAEEKTHVILKKVFDIKGAVKQLDSTNKILANIVPPAKDCKPNVVPIISTSGRGGKEAEKQRKRSLIMKKNEDVGMMVLEGPRGGKRCTSKIITRDVSSSWNCDANSENRLLLSKKKLIRKENLRHLANVNAQRCKPYCIYGIDGRESMTIYSFEKVKMMRKLWNEEFDSRENGRKRLKADWKCVGYENIAYTLFARCVDNLMHTYTNTLHELVKWDIGDRAAAMSDILERFVAYVPRVQAGRPILHCIKSNLEGVRRMKVLEEKADVELKSLEMWQSGAFEAHNKMHSRLRTYFPEPRLIQYDCGKLQQLDVLLRKLKAGDHRVLIFTQMTKMLDVLEVFLTYHGHKYLRLDGSTKVEQRQLLMEQFNANKRYFVFILSTRSGGLGINLTGADTVIFYDSDWNPTMDAQAQDRCHRIGQTRDVNIYRLISEKTVEENILKKANQKRLLGDVAIEGGNFDAASFKRSTIIDLFKTDAELVFDGDVEETAEEVEASKEKTAQFKSLEEALASKEDESDRDAMEAANKEVVADMAEFDETIPIVDRNEDNEMKEIADTEEEMKRYYEELSGIEKFAYNKVENADLSEWTDRQVAATAADLEEHKKSWELARQTSMKACPSAMAPISVEPIPPVVEMDQGPPLTYSMSLTKPQSFKTPDGKGIMPIYAPCCTLHGYYHDPVMRNYSKIPMKEEEYPPPLPPKKEDKKILTANKETSMEKDIIPPVQSPPQQQLFLPPQPVQMPVAPKGKKPKQRQTSTQQPPKKKQKTRLVDPYMVAQLQQQIQQQQQQMLQQQHFRQQCNASFMDAPKSLFEKSSPLLSKIRNDVRLQKYRDLPRSALPIPYPGNLPLGDYQMAKQYLDAMEDWAIYEDYALLQAVLTYNELPLHLSSLYPSQCINWDYAAQLVNKVSVVYRSPLQCNYRYENTIWPRESGKCYVDASKKAKKDKSRQLGFPVMPATNTPPSPPHRSTLQAFKEDGLDNMISNLQDSLNNIKSHVGMKGSSVMRWKHQKLKWAELARDPHWKSTSSPLLGPFLKPMTIMQSRMDRLCKEKQLLTAKGVPVASGGTQTPTQIQVSGPRQLYRAPFPTSMSATPPPISRITPPPVSMITPSPGSRVSTSSVSRVFPTPPREVPISPSVAYPHHQVAVRKIIVATNQNASVVVDAATGTRGTPVLMRSTPRDKSVISTNTVRIIPTPIATSVVQTGVSTNVQRTFSNIVNPTPGIHSIVIPSPRKAQHIQLYKPQQQQMTTKQQQGTPAKVQIAVSNTSVATAGIIHMQARPVTKVANSTEGTLVRSIPEVEYAMMVQIKQQQKAQQLLRQQQPQVQQQQSSTQQSSNPVAVATVPISTKPAFLYDKKLKQYLHITSEPGTNKKTAESLKLTPAQTAQLHQHFQAQQLQHKNKIVVSRSATGQPLLNLQKAVIGKRMISVVQTGQGGNAVGNVAAIAAGAHIIDSAGATTLMNTTSVASGGNTTIQHVSSAGIATNSAQNMKQDVQVMQGRIGNHLAMNSSLRRTNPTFVNQVPISVTTSTPGMSRQQNIQTISSGQQTNTTTPQVQPVQRRFIGKK